MLVRGRVITPVAFVVAALTTPVVAEPRSVAVRAGWAYGLGLEVEYRPNHWGIGASGGYVPSYGPGGYLGVQWGHRSLGSSGFVAEAGLFRGVHNPLRVADTGIGLYAMGGYTLVWGRMSARGVAGGGLPLGDNDHPISIEFIAKLTVGFLF